MHLESTHLTSHPVSLMINPTVNFQTLNGRAKKGIIGDEYPLLKRSLIM